MGLSENWIATIVDKVYECYRGRQVVLWGKYSVSESIKNELKDRHGINIAFYVDSNAEKTDNVQVFLPDCLKGKS